MELHVWVQFRTSKSGHFSFAKVKLWAPEGGALLAPSATLEFGLLRFMRSTLVYVENHAYVTTNKILWSTLVYALSRVIITFWHPYVLKNTPKGKGFNLYV